MAKVEKRPKAKAPEKEEVIPSPGPHDAPGLSPFERMRELTRRVVNVSPKELASERRKDERKRGGH
jgi:hypothetical protein